MQCKTPDAVVSAFHNPGPNSSAGDRESHAQASYLPSFPKRVLGKQGRVGMTVMLGLLEVRKTSGYHPIYARAPVRQLHAQHHFPSQ